MAITMKYIIKNSNISNLIEETISTQQLIGKA